MENEEQPNSVPAIPLTPATPIKKEEPDGPVGFIPPHQFKLSVQTKVWAAYYLKESPIPEPPKDEDFGGSEDPLDPGFGVDPEPEEPEETKPDTPVEPNEGEKEPDVEQGDEVSENQLSLFSDEELGEMETKPEGGEEPTPEPEPSEPSEPENPDPDPDPEPEKPKTFWEPVIFYYAETIEKVLWYVSQLYKTYQHQVPIYIGEVVTSATLNGQGEIKHSPIEPPTNDQAPTAALFRESCEDPWRPGVFGKIIKQTTVINGEKKPTYLNQADGHTYLMATPLTKESQFLVGTKIANLITVEPFTQGTELPPLTGETEGPKDVPPFLESPSNRYPGGSSDPEDPLQRYPFIPRYGMKGWGF